jgi:hypothetical protein
VLANHVVSVMSASVVVISCLIIASPTCKLVANGHYIGVNAPDAINLIGLLLFSRWLNQQRT